VKHLNKCLISQTVLRDVYFLFFSFVPLHILACRHVPTHTQDELSDLSEQQVKHMYGHSGSITALCFTPDQQMLLSASTDGTVRLWATQWYRNLAAYKCVDSGSGG
jgi:WD40 repeat protein